MSESALLYIKQFFVCFNQSDIIGQDLNVHIAFLLGLTVSFSIWLGKTLLQVLDTVMDVSQFSLDQGET